MRIRPTFDQNALRAATGPIRALINVTFPSHVQIVIAAPLATVAALRGRPLHDQRTFTVFEKFLHALSFHAVRRTRIRKEMQISIWSRIRNATGGSPFLAAL